MLNRARHMAFTALVLGAYGPIALAQITATWHWQLSGDSGATWSNDLLHREPSGSVLVRGQLGWTGAPEGTYFAGTTGFDVSVAALTGGFTDHADMFASEPIRGPYLHDAFAALRFGNTLKLDDARDLEAPGLGPQWIRPIEDPPIIGVVRNTNPVILFQFRLLLDGSMGDRVVSHVFRPGGTPPPDHRIALYVAPYFGGPATYVQTSSFPATLRVVPSPGAATMLGVGAIVIVRRRR